MLLTKTDPLDRKYRLIIRRLRAGTFWTKHYNHDIIIRVVV